MLVVISGHSAAGKDSLAEKLIADHGPEVALAITATTRPPRLQERDGIDYHFVTPGSFARMESVGELLESATVYGNRYGVPRASVREALERAPIALVGTDVQGASSIKSLLPQTLLIFVTAPSIADLERRMRARGGVDDEAVARRLAHVDTETEFQHQFDYTIVNEDGRLDAAAESLWEIIMSEANRPERGAIEI